MSGSNILNLKELIEGSDYKTFRLTYSDQIPELRSIFQRWADYESSSPIIKDLLSLIYPDKYSYVVTPTPSAHPIEKYIFAFDEVMDDPQMIRALGTSIGINVYLDPNREAYEIFLDKLIAHLDFLLTQKRDYNIGLDIVKYSSIKKLPTTAEMMFYTRPQFFKLMKDYSISLDSETMEYYYYDRLKILRKLTYLPN